MSHYSAENFEQVKDEDLRIINKFVNKKITGEEVWRFFTKTDDVSIFNVSIVHELLFSSLKWHYEIIQQQPLDYEKVDEILRELREQIRIDKPNVFLNNMVQQMKFTNLLEYLRLMYAGGFAEMKRLDDESSIIVSEPGLLDDFTKQGFPNVPFPCQLSESTEIKAWSQTLQKLTINEINAMRGEIGNAIDWNKLNDTFLVDFKGLMYWFQKESIQAADEKAFSGASVSLRSEAETTSLTNEAARSDARSGDGQKTPVSRDDSLPANYLPRGRRSFSVGLGQNPNTPPSSYNRSSSSHNPVHARYYSQLNSSSTSYHHTPTSPHKPFSPPASGSHRKYSDGNRFHASRSFPTQNSPYHPLIEGEKYKNPSPHENQHRHHPPHRSFQSSGKLNDQGFHVIQGNPPTFDKTPSPTPERQFRSHKLRSRTPERNILFPHKRNHQKQKEKQPPYNNLSPISLHNKNVHNNNNINSNFHHQKKYPSQDQGMDEILGGVLPDDDMSDFSEDIDITQYFQSRTQQLYSMGRRSRKRNPTESRKLPVNSPPANDLVVCGRNPKQIDGNNVINPINIYNNKKKGSIQKNIRSRSACLSSDFPNKILTHLPDFEEKIFSDEVPQNTYFTEDKFRLRDFFSQYGVPDTDILKMAGRQIHIEEWNAHQKRCLITLNGEKIWLPRDITVLPKEQLLGREKEVRNMSLTPILGEPLNLANNMPILNYDSQSVTLSIKEIKKKLTEQKEKQMRERKSSLGSPTMVLRERSLSTHSRYKNSRQHNRREHNLSNFSRQSSHLSYNRSRSLPEEKFTENPVENISSFSHNNNPYSESIPNLSTLISSKQFSPRNTEKNNNRRFTATAASPTHTKTTTPTSQKNLQNVQNKNLEKNHQAPPLATLIIKGKPPPSNNNLISSSSSVSNPNMSSSSFSSQQNPQSPPPSTRSENIKQQENPTTNQHKKNIRRSVSTPNENTPTSILKNPRKISVSSEKRTNFNLEPALIPSPGTYYITRNRQIISKKCIIHRLDARRLISLMGRRVEITKINRDLIGTFENKERTYLIPMSCCSASR